MTMARGKRMKTLNRTSSAAVIERRWTNGVDAKRPLHLHAASTLKRPLNDVSRTPLSKEH
jgi:hypothetical protein